jgi:hypothetical protein
LYSFRLSVSVPPFASKGGTLRSGPNRPAHDDSPGEMMLANTDLSSIEPRWSNPATEQFTPDLNESPVTPDSNESPAGARKETSAGTVPVLARVARRNRPISASVLFLVTGMAFMLAWDPLVDHVSSWATGGDLWGIFRGAHFVAWGYLGGVYTGNGVVAFPGMEILLAPVAMLASSLHLTESFPPIIVNRPTAALILQPVELAVSCTVLFAADALAERLGLASARRTALCFILAVIVWPVAAMWGHAEDALSVTFALYALLAMLNGNWKQCGWLFGLGILFQPLVGLLIPLILAAAPRGARVTLLLRAASLSVVILSIAFIGNPSGTYTAIVKQPTPPSVNHATPWASLSPIVFKSSTIHATRPKVEHRNGHFEITEVSGPVHVPDSVSGGAGRLLDVVFAALVGLYVWRRPRQPLHLLWFATLILSSRCFFEPVMTPYYLAPPLLLGTALCANAGWRQLLGASVIAFEITIYSYYHLSAWKWWLPMVAGLGAILALGYPGRTPDSLLDNDFHRVAAGPLDRDQRGSVLAPAPVP